MKRSEIKVGQTVMVWDGGGRAKAEPIRGTVIDVAKVWITVHREGEAWGWRFRLDSQTDGGSIGHPARFYTLDQWAEHLREQAATAFLRAQGITVEWSSKHWVHRKIELATLLGWTPDAVEQS